MEEIENFFKATLTPREFNNKEIEDFYKFTNVSDRHLYPEFEGCIHIWATLDSGKEPVYRLYDRGTNCLIIYKYNWEKDIWEKITIEEIHNIYGLLWLLCLKIHENKNKGE